MGPPRYRNQTDDAIRATLDELDVRVLPLLAEPLSPTELTESVRTTAIAPDPVGRRGPA